MRSDRLYTFVLDYAGGTYISQLRAANQQDAFDEWLERLVPHEIAVGVSLEVAGAFHSNEDNELVPLNSLSSVWCKSALGENGLVLVNVMHTCDEN